MIKKLYHITDENGVDQPAYLHKDGTIVSHWDNLSKLLINDEFGTRYTSHVEAKKYGYEK